MKQAKKYPAPQISEAVFRGRNALYNFEVYPMNVRFNEVPAVYIISKRKIDRNGRGHHFLVCIGQTESLVEDIKKHKRGRCVKQLQANTVSVILEDDENKRLEVESDLKSAHTIPCHHDAADEEFFLKSIVKPAPSKVKIEAREKAVQPPMEIPSKNVKKPSPKQAEAKAEVSPVEKVKKVPAKNKVKADLPETKSGPKKQTVGKKPETVKSAKAVEPKKEGGNKKIETKAQTAKVFAKSQKAEASKTKQTPPKVTKTKFNQKLEVSKPKKVGPAKLKAEKKQSSPKTVRTLKKSTGNQVKSKAQGKAESAKPKSGAPKIDQAKVTKAKTSETPKKAKKIAEKITTAKSPKIVKSAKTPNVKKAQGNIKISGKAKIESKTSQPKTGAKAKTVEPKKIKQTKSAKIVKPEKPKPIKASKITKPEKAAPVKAKAKTEAPKSKETRVTKIKANTKPNTGIKPRIKGKENRLKSSPRKRLAF
jgi:histone H1/5